MRAGKTDWPGRTLTLESTDGVLQPDDDGLFERGGDQIEVAVAVEIDRNRPDDMDGRRPGIEQADDGRTGRGRGE